MNRPKLLLRLICYYYLLEFRGKILIGDSSNTKVFQEMARALEKYKDRLDICHYHLPGRSVAAAVLDMNEHLTTPYVCLVPDDDFIVPRAITKCIRFLDDHHDYIAAHGLGALISSSSGDSGIIDSAGFYPQTTIEEATASIRLHKHSENYSVSLFSVYRFGIWRKMFMNIATPCMHPQCCDKSFTDELLPCCLSVVYGKIKQIDGLYLVRQVHDARYLLPTWYQWLTGEKWQPSYLWFRDKVTGAISEMDCIPLQRAQEVVDLGLMQYLRKSVGLKRPEGLGGRIRRIAKRCIPNAGLAVLRRFRPWFVSGYLSLESLMDPTSPYHQDFLQIYNSVTRQERDAQELI
jgi:glycosyltransferase domain-containing protein